MHRLTFLAAVVGIAVGGCGSSGSDKTADMTALATCISNHGSPSTPLTTSDAEGLDLIAQGAGVGALQVTSPHNELQVVAERTSADAEGTVSQYEAFDLGEVDQVGTVVLAYNNSPITEESGPVLSCLDEQGIH